MNEKLDLINLLKDCPKGMPLNCTIFDGSVTFNGIVDDDLYPIEIKIDNNYEERLNKYGGYNNSPYCKCVIFPKDKTTWAGFQRPFKDGDILYIDCNDSEDTYKEFQYTFILKEIKEDKIYCYCYIDEAGINERFETCWLTDLTYTPQFASQIEKDKLYEVLRSEGYKWNTKTKTLEKLIKPKFKVGDKIKEKNELFPSTRTISNYTESIGYFTTINDCVRIEDQDNWELVSDEIKPKFKVGDRIRGKIGLQTYNITNVTSEYYSTKVGEHAIVGILPVKDQDDFILIPSKFDPKTLQPFDKVLASYNDEWFCDFFSHYEDSTIKFNCICTGGGPYDYCIPYNDDTKHLIGKSIEDTPEFYRHWEK